MAYTPTVWETGDVITAEKLNKAEEGIADACVYMIPIDYDPETSEPYLQASFDDIYTAVSAGRLVLLKDEQSEKTVSLRWLNGTLYDDHQSYPYQVYFHDGNNSLTFRAENSTDNLVQAAE